MAEPEGVTGATGSPQVVADGSGDVIQPVGGEVAAEGAPDNEDGAQPPAEEEAVAYVPASAIEELESKLEAHYGTVIDELRQQVWNYRKMIAAMLVSGGPVTITPTHMSEADPRKVEIKSSFEGYTTLSLNGQLWRPH